jgi:hypothetical protein
MSHVRKSLASHAALIPIGPGKGTPQGFWDDAALLAMPVTDRDAQRAERVWLEQQKDAARGVARWSMLDGHGCTGAGCRSPQHAAGAEVRDLLLDVLGVGR